MAATGTPTPNIGLRIPQGTDPASVDDINYNSNLLDTKLGAVGETSVQDQIDSLNSKVTQSQGYSGLNNKVTWRTMGNLCQLVIYGLAFADASQMASAGVPAPSMGYVSISLYNASENCGRIEYANGAWSGIKNTSSGYTNGYGTAMYLIN